MKKSLPKLASGITPDLIKDITLWFVTNDKWTKEINTKSQFLLHNLIWSESTKSATQEDIKKIGNNPVLYLTGLIIRDVEKCFQNKNKFRDLIQKLFDLSGETLKRCSKIVLKYSINTEKFDLDRAMKKIGRTKEQAQFANSLYFDRMISARLRILGWIYHELYGEWIKDFLKKEDGKVELNEIKKFEAKIRDYKDYLFGASLFYEEVKLTWPSSILKSVKFEKHYRDIIYRGEAVINRTEKILSEAKINHNINKLKETKFPPLEKDIMPIYPDNMPRFKLLVETYNELFPRRDRKVPLTEKEHRLIMSKVIDKF